MDKQIVRVLDAVNDGYATTREVSRETGIPARFVGSCLSRLARDGVIRRSDPDPRMHLAQGRPSNIYQPM